MLSGSVVRWVASMGVDRDVRYQGAVSVRLKRSRVVFAQRASWGSRSSVRGWLPIRFTFIQLKELFRRRRHRRHLGRFDDDQIETYRDQPEREPIETEYLGL